MPSIQMTRESLRLGLRAHDPIVVVNRFDSKLSEIMMISSARLSPHVATMVAKAKLATRSAQSPSQVLTKKPRSQHLPFEVSATSCRFCSAFHLKRLRSAPRRSGIAPCCIRRLRPKQVWEVEFVRSDDATEPESRSLSRVCQEFSSSHELMRFFNTLLAVGQQPAGRGTLRAYDLEVMDLAHRCREFHLHESRRNKTTCSARQYVTRSVLYRETGVPEHTAA